MAEKQYLIINTSELDLVNFNEVHETNEDSLRRSIDGNKVLIKWEGAEPAFVASLTSKNGPHAANEIKALLLSNEWVAPFSY